MRGSIPARDQLTQTCSFASPFGFPHLPDLQEMSIRVKEEGPGLLEIPSRFSLYPCEFFRVGNDANRLDLPLLHLNGQDGEYLAASADDHGCLTVDFL